MKGWSRSQRVSPGAGTGEESSGGVVLDCPCVCVPPPPPSPHPPKTSCLNSCLSANKQGIRGSFVSSAVPISHVELQRNTFKERTGFACTQMLCNKTNVNIFTHCQLVSIRLSPWHRDRPYWSIHLVTSKIMKLLIF